MASSYRPYVLSASLFAGGSLFGLLLSTLLALGIASNDNFKTSMQRGDDAILRRQAGVPMQMSSPPTPHSTPE
jgi:hypothetical protein